ncbi:CD209 antigen-like protein E isoform X2 [Girardinichthys multiradiatus]|uniref:CD209 antigen-like protein E isoform X2 n=1 Tax=Girardinichthys multiradiatus TaxID=208333 RepID=UPI001FAC4F31|nr:CD209 antigen-like protein E isoform X2 [Girardinichthys multiradiatus]
MDRKAQSLDEEIEEHHYVNEAVGVEENVRSALGHRFPSFSQFSPLLAAYWLILLVVIPLHIHFHIKVEFELKLLKANRAALMAKNQNLTTELEQVKNQMDNLKNINKNLTEQMEPIKKTWNEQNISRAQWSIDEYCRMENNKRTCVSCQKGWLQYQSSCYAVNNVEPQHQKTWEEARENCRGISSDLTVVDNEAEKVFVKDMSWVNNRIKGYWIGLRVEEGKWKWIDGSDLTNQTWMQQQSATDGQCVTSHQNQEWRSVRCNETNAWICQKKALSV